MNREKEGIKVVILCGGFGSRLKEQTEVKPKPMVEIGRMPILWHIMKTYAHYGFHEFILCLGYKGEVIKEYFYNYEMLANDFTIELGTKSFEVHSNHSESGWKVTLVDTGLNAMTGARVKRIERLIDGDTFMLTYGDGVGDIDIDALLKFHRSHGKVMTVTGVHPPGRFGEMRANSSGIVTGFNEKPQVASGCISGGYFVCRNAIFDYLNDADDLVFEKEPMRRLVEDKQMMVYQHDGFWQPMDTHREYLLLNEMYENDQAPWVKWHE